MIDWSHTRQGDLLNLTAPLQIPKWEEDIGQVFLVSQTCDIVQPKRERVIVAPVVEEDAAEYQQALKGKISHLIALPAAVGTHRVARLDLMCSFPKNVFAGSSVSIVGNSEVTPESRKLSRELGAYFSRFPVPDHVRTSIQPIIAQLRSDMSREQRKKVLNDVLEFRVQAHPSWESQEISLEISGIGSATAFPPTSGGADIHSFEWAEDLKISDVYAKLALATNADERVVLWNRLAACLEEKADLDGRVTSVSVYMISEDDFSYADWRDSESLNIEALSPIYPVPTSGN